MLARSVKKDGFSFVVVAAHAALELMAFRKASFSEDMLEGLIDREVEMEI